VTLHLFVNSPDGGGRSPLISTGECLEKSRIGEEHAERELIDPVLEGIRLAETKLDVNDIIYHY
jgi:hypothetical protein